MTSVLPLSKYNVERSAGIGGSENQFAAMVLFDNATREGESDAPSALLRRETRIEHARSKARGNAGPVVGDADAHSAVRNASGRHANPAAASSECVDRVLGQHLDGPLEE